MEPTTARPWHDVPALSLSPVAIDVDAEDWHAAVAGAAAHWRDELASAGCPIEIEVSAHGHEVRGWTAAAWPHPPHWLGATGTGANESIDVIAELDDHKLHEVLTHELGHVLGLGHVEVVERESVMNPRGGELDAEDVDAAARSIGCY